MTMQRFFLIGIQLVILVALAACSKDLDVELPYAGDQLVINGVLTPGQLIRLRVSKTAPVSGNLTDNLGLADATVALYEDSVFRETLRHTEQGTYVSPSGYEPVAGRSYFVRVSAEGFAPAETRPERVPLPFTLNTYAFDEAIQSSLNSQYPARKLTLTFSDDPNGEDYYSIEIRGYSQGYELGINAYYLDVPFDAADPCGFLSGNGGDLQYNLTDICFNGATRQVNFGVETSGSPSAEYRAAFPDRAGVFGSFGEIDCDQITVSVKKITKSYYEYLKTNSQPEGAFLAFIEPYVLHSNVTGGLGLLAAANEYKLAIKL